MRQSISFPSRQIPISEAYFLGKGDDSEGLPGVFVFLNLDKTIHN